MAWMNSLQLEKKYSSPDFQKSFRDLFTLRILHKNCLVSSEYKPPKEFEKAIELTTQGEKWFSIVEKSIADISIPEIKLSLFIFFLPRPVSRYNTLGLWKYI